MIQSAPLFLALRYLRPRRSFVSVITIVSLLGVAMGVMMMIVVRAVMVGFEEDFRDTLMGTKPHVMLHAAAPSTNWPPVLDQIKTLPGVVSAVPCVTGSNLYLANGDAQAVAQLFAIPAQDASRHFGKIRPHLLAGSLDLIDGSLILTDQQLQNLGLRIGDEVSVYAETHVNEAVRQYSDANEQDDEQKRQAILDKVSLHPQKLRISGALRSEAVGLLACASLTTGQAIFQLGSGISGIAVELDHPEQAQDRAEDLAQAAPGWRVETWADEEKARLAAMKNEQTMMQFVLSIIALVAAFSVMNTTITVTTQKRREIGMLAAIGGSGRQIINVFLLQAAIVGVAGTGLGLGGGLLVLWLRNDLREWLALATGGQVHAVEGVFLSTIPARVDPEHLLMTCAFSLTLCLVAGLLPAWVAARMEPAQALRD